MIAALALLLAEPSVVAARALPRGTVLTEAAVEAKGGADLRDYLGMKLSRPVFAGRVIEPADLSPPDLVERQSAVTVAYTRGAMTLRLPGRAVRSGGAGEVVTVLIDGRRRPLRGVVTGPGQVEVAP